MKQKFIDVRTSINGEINDALCINNATGKQLESILTLAVEGYEILVIVHEKEVTSPNHFENEK